MHTAAKVHDLLKIPIYRLSSSCSRRLAPYAPTYIGWVECKSDGLTEMFCEKKNQCLTFSIIQIPLCIVFKHTWIESSSELFWSHVVQCLSVRLFTFLTFSPKPNLSQRVMGIPICSNEGPYSFQRGDNYKIVKMYWHILKYSSPELLDKFYPNLTQSLLR